MADQGHPVKLDKWGSPITPEEDAFEKALREVIIEETLRSSPYAQIVKASVTHREAVDYSKEVWQNKVVAIFQREASYWQSEEGQQEQILVDGLKLNLHMTDFQAKDALRFYDKYLSATEIKDKEQEVKAFITDICSQIGNTTLTATAKLTGISLLARCFGDTADPMIIDAIRSQIREQERQAAHPKLKLLKPPWDYPDEKPQPPAEPTVTKESKQDKWSATITLGHTKAGQPIQVTQEDLCSGFYSLGVQKMGKSSLLENIVYQQMERDECIIVFDLKGGDLIRNIIARMPAHKLSKTYLLNLTDETHPFNFNPFACKDVNNEKSRRIVSNSVERAFEKLWPGTEQQQYIGDLLPPLIDTLIECPELTIAHIPHFLRDRTFRHQYVSKLKNFDTQDFWLEEYSQTQKTQTKPLLRRVRRLLKDGIVKRILCQRGDKSDTRKIDFREAIVDKQIILINLPVDVPGYEYAAPVVGTLLLSAIYKATFSFADTPESERPGFTLIVDEFDYVVTSDYERFFGKARGFKVKQFLAHQYRSQLDREAGTTTRDATLTAHTVISFKTNPKDARSEIADKFKGLTRRPSNIHPSPLDKKREWQEHEDKDKRVKEFFHYIQELDALYKQDSLKAQAIWKRLNNFLYDCQDQAGKLGGNWWPHQAESEAVLLDLAHVLGKVHTRTEKIYNYILAEQLEQEKQRLPGVKARLARERDTAMQALRDRYTREYRALADELAALKHQEKEHWEILSPQERAIVRRGDDKLASAGLLTWGTLERRVKEYQENHPFDSLFLPWTAYVRLCTKREAIHMELWHKDIEKSQALSKPPEEVLKAIRKEYEEKIAQVDRKIKQMENQLWLYTYKEEIDREFADEFDGMVQALIDQPIASDKAELDITAALLKLEQREALISIGSRVYEMKTVDLNSAYPKVPPFEFHRRELQIQAQTRDKYCRERSQVEREIYSLLDPEEEEEEQKPEQTPKPNSGKGKRAGKNKDSRNQTQKEERTAMDDDDLPYADYDED